MDYTSLSKTVAHALRHEPWLYELELDEEGWTAIDALLVSLRRMKPKWRRLERRHLEAMIARSDKRRYEIRGDRIRALYGHSLSDKLRKVPAAPPAVLFHGTDPAIQGRIRREGLKPMGRQYVHLSANRDLAKAVGRRKAQRPLVLRIEAGAAYAAGVAFYEGNDKVWLADVVPPEFIETVGR